MALPTLQRHPLHRADGSTTYTSPHDLHTILAAVNGPIEVTRRDEIPDEAALEINLRPASGVGGPRERWLESVIGNVLRSVVLVYLHPRTLVQVTLQVVSGPSYERVGGKRVKGAVRDIALLPSLVNAAVLTLVDAAIPMGCTMASTLVAVGKDGHVTINPPEKELANCSSCHAFAFSQNGEMLLCESAGQFVVEEWEAVAAKAERACLAAMAPKGEDEEMEGNGDAVPSVPWLRQELEDQARKAVAWREQET
jgi:exosome complex component RRP46